MFKNRKGFTLVELLIVIVIIGILAAAMLLSSGSATDSAEASNIISDLRSLKAGALMLYADSMDSVGTPTLAASAFTVQNLSRYADNPNKFTTGPNANKYRTAVLTSAQDAVNLRTGTWLVGFQLSTNATDHAGIRGRLSGRAASVGLYGGGNTTQNVDAAAVNAAGLAVYTGSSTLFRTES